MRNMQWQSKEKYMLRNRRAGPRSICLSKVCVCSVKLSFCSGIGNCIVEMRPILLDSFTKENWPRWSRQADSYVYLHPPKIMLYILRRPATHCGTLQQTAAYCNKPKHTATRAQAKTLADVYLHTHMNIHISTSRIHMNACMYDVRMFVCMYACKCMYIYIYIYVCIHTHIHFSLSSGVICIHVFALAVQLQHAALYILHYTTTYYNTIHHSSAHYINRLSTSIGIM